MNKKLTPIWDELSAIGEAAPTGTWDNVPTDLSTMGETSMTDQPHNTARQSTPDSVLLSQLMDPNLAKNEREWFAAAEIERLTVENERLKAELSAIRAGGGGAGIGYTPIGASGGPGGRR